MNQTLSVLPELPENPNSRANKVWQLLAQIFPGSFTRQLGDEPPLMWRRSIDRMNDDQLRRALNQMATEDRGAKFLGRIPTLPEFNAAGRAPQQYLGVPETEDQRQKRISVVRASPEVAAKYIKKMKVSVGRKDG